MKKFLNIILLFAALALSLAACTSKGGTNEGFFQHYFVNTFADLIHGAANIFSGNYGLAIIFITLLIRLLLMPLMLRQYKNQQIMKEKMELLKPEMEELQKKLKETKDQEKQKELQMELMGLYKKHGVNPLAMGCLPLLIQMPILMGFYYAIRGSHEIATHSFLWFNLGSPDIWITAVAGIVYYLQFKVSSGSMPAEQQQQAKIMGLMSPIMIVLISLNAPAALPLYWSFGGIFLIGQSLLGQKLYKKKETVASPIQNKNA